MFPPHHFGGYELVWAAAVDHLRLQGHGVRILTTDPRTGSSEPDGADVHRELHWHLRDGEFEQLGLRARVATAAHNHRVLERHLDAIRPDVVTWWSMGGLSLTMLETVRRRGMPSVAFVHDDWLDYGRWADPWLRIFRGRHRGSLAPIAERVTGIPARGEVRSAATYVFLSDFTRQHALALGLSSTDVAHSGIHADFLEPAPERTWDWRLLYVGRLDARKGVHVAVEALAHLPAQSRLEIAGGWDRGEEE